MGVMLVFLVIALALVGMPLFAVMGGSTELLWLTHPDPSQRLLERLAPNILEDKFAGSPILVTIPLFTFIGYMMAESKAPDRIVRASSALLGWLPGGLAMVCIVASSVFTVVTGGSGVTIVAIGGLLYPALRKQGYPADYALGLVTTGGSLGLLLPSLPLMVYALVAGLDLNAAFKAGLIPAVFIMLLLAVHAFYIGVKHKLPRSTPNLREMGGALWLLKWELLIPIVLLGSYQTGLAAGLDEAAALTAVYTLVVEFFVHKDLSIKKDLLRVAKASMALAGAIIIILSMANALINFVVQENIPARVLQYMLGLGLTETWQFLIVLNIFLLVLGMLMEGFSAILVAVPLVLPFAALFNLHPFHLAIMFLLNLEIAYVAPPLGLNLFIASFRFDKPLVSLYRVVLPFAGILVLGLLVVMYVPKVSTVLIDGDIEKKYALAEKNQEAPRDAWLLQCVQEDRSNPVPCTAADKARFGEDGTKNPYLPETPPTPDQPAPDADAADAGAPSGGDDDLFAEMMGGKDGGAADAGAPSEDAGQMAPSGEKGDANEDLFKEMMR
jgi:C4-dicarboxylate transporter DctM subunit